jgi:large subunit ribosomal protein L18
MADLNRKKVLEKKRRRTRAHQRSRQRLAGTSERPRLCVFKSERYVYAQLIDDEKGHTLASATSQDAALKGAAATTASSKEAARRVGEAVAARALEKGIKRVVFDRGGYRYHGKVKELADAARAKGLEF